MLLDASLETAVYPLDSTPDTILASPETTTEATAPAVSANEFDTAAVKPDGVNVRVKLPAVPVMTRLVKVATPLPFVETVVVPVSTPEPDVMVATTLRPEVLTLLLLASCNCTIG